MIAMRSGEASSAATSARNHGITAHPPTLDFQGPRPGAAEFQRGAHQPIGIVQSALLGMLFGHVVKDENDAAHRAIGLENRRRGILDGKLGAIASAEHGVFGQADDHALAQHACDRIFRRRAGLLIENGEHLRQRAAARLLSAPARELLRHGIEKGDSAGLIRGEHRIADGTERSMQFIALCAGQGEAAPIRATDPRQETAEGANEQRHADERGGGFSL